MRWIIVVSSLMLSTIANAAVLDFENYLDIGSLQYNALIEDGYVVKYDNSKRFSGWGTSNPTKNGLVAVDPPYVDAVRLVKADGGLFTINTIDLGNVSQTIIFDLIFTGIKQNNQTITQTFTLSDLSNNTIGIPMVTFNFDNFTGLKELYWLGSDYANGVGYAFDNINVTEYVPPQISVVPEPNVIWLFAAVLPLLGFRVTNKNTKTPIN